MEIFCSVFLIEETYIKRRVPFREEGRMNLILSEESRKMK
jgi:hypothetical protein